MATYAHTPTRRPPHPALAAAARRTGTALAGVEDCPAPRTIRRALGVLQRLPVEALADLTERLVDRLDMLTPDADLEVEDDYCEAEDTCVMFRGWP